MISKLDTTLRITPQNKDPTKTTHIMQARTNELQHDISNKVVCVTRKGSDQSAHMRSLIRAFASCLNILWLLSYLPISVWSF